MNYNCKKCQVEVVERFGSGIYCSRKCANARNWSADAKALKSESAKKSAAVATANSKFRKKYTVERITKNCKHCASTFTSPITENRIYCTRICHHAAIKANVDNQYGGLRKGSGRGQKGWYKGYWCDSSWELAWVMYNIDHNISFSRNTKQFPYIFEGKVRNYTPDFKIDNQFIEIKGYHTPQVQAKTDAFPHQLLVLNKEAMQPYLQYAITVYGTDYTKYYK